jgi:hypothetical protein
MRPLQRPLVEGEREQQEEQQVLAVLDGDGVQADAQVLRVVVPHDGLIQQPAREDAVHQEEGDQAHRIAQVETAQVAALQHEHMQGQHARRAQEGDGRVDAVDVYDADHQEQGHQCDTERAGEAAQNVTAHEMPQRFVDEHAAVGHHQEEEPLLDGQVEELGTGEVARVEAPHAVRREDGIPEDEYRGHHRDAGEEPRPLAPVLQLGLEASQEREGQGEQVEAEVVVMFHHAAPSTRLSPAKKITCATST